LSEIIVTARRVAENLQNVPGAVTAFSGEQLRQQNAVRVKDIALLTPGLNLRDSNVSGSAPVISIRGQVQTDILATLDPSVATYVDGYYWARAYGLDSDLLDIQSVQTLKGPQGTLFGRNTTGGAILIQTNDPNFRGPSGFLSVSYGRFNDRQGVGIVNLPIVADKVAVRFAISGHARDGYITNLFNNRKEDNINNWAFRGKLLIAPTDDLRIVLSSELYNSQSRPQPWHLGYIGAGSLGIRSYAALTGLSVANATVVLNNYIAANSFSDTYSTNSAPASIAHAETYTALLTAKSPIGAVKIVGGYRRIRGTALNDVDGTPATIIASDLVPPHGYVQDVSQYAVEANLTGSTLGRRLDYVAGAMYFREQGVQDSASITLIGVNPNNPNYTDGYVRNTSWGVYGQLEYHFSDQWSMSGGLRYSKENKGLTLHNRAYSAAAGGFACSIAGTVLPNCTASRSDPFSGLDYSATINYKPVEDVLLYGKIARGFRSGGENLGATGSAALTFEPFKPEVARSYEVGLKTEFFDHHLRFNSAAYFTNLTDIQRTRLATTPTGALATLLGNAGKAHVSGVEGEVSALVADGLRLSGSVAVTAPKYIIYFDGVSDHTADRSYYIPRYTFSLSADYTRQMSFGLLSVRADYAYTGRTDLNGYNNVANPANATIATAISAPASGILNGRVALSWKDGAYEFAVYGRNLTNSRVNTNGIYVAAPLDLTAFLRHEPVTFGASFTMKFGRF